MHLSGHHGHKNVQLHSTCRRRRKVLAEGTGGAGKTLSCHAEHARKKVNLGILNHQTNPYPGRRGFPHSEGSMGLQMGLSP